MLEYDFTYDCQGTDELVHTCVLMHCPEDATFENIRSMLFQRKYNKYHHVIDLDSVVDVTIEW